MAASSMKDIKLRIKSVESTMQITKAMELVAVLASCGARKERVESRRGPISTTLHATPVQTSRTATRSFPSSVSWPAARSEKDLLYRDRRRPRAGRRLQYQPV